MPYAAEIFIRFSGRLALVVINNSELVMLRNYALMIENTIDC